MTVIELAEKTYLDAHAETRRCLESRGPLSAAAALAREQVVGHALLIAKAEAGECFRVGCRERVEWEYCDAHLREVAS